MQHLVIFKNTAFYDTPLGVCPLGNRTCEMWALNQPLDLISTEIVFRSLYHFSQAVLRGDANDAVTYLVEHQ